MRSQILLGTVALVALLAGCGGRTQVAGPPPSGEATREALAAPESLAFDENGDLFISEFEGHKVVEVKPDGTLVVIAGDGTAGFAGDGGAASKAELNAPCGLVATPDGRLLVADHHNNRIRVVDAAGSIATVRGSTEAKLSDPIGIALDDDGTILIADEQNARVVRLDRDGHVHAVAGGARATRKLGTASPATSTRLSHPSYVLRDADGRVVFTDFLANRILRIDANGAITTVAGDGTSGFSGDGGAAVKAQLAFPTGLAMDSEGNLFVSDADNNRVRRISSNGKITTVAGTGRPGFSGDGGPASAAMLDAPAGLAFDDAGNLYIADQGNDRVRRLDADGVITTVAGGA